MLANGCDWIRAVSGSIWVFEFLNIISPPYCMNTMNACKWLWLVEEGIGFRSTIPRLNSQGADLPAGPAAKYYLCKRLPSHSLAQSMLTLGSPCLPAGWVLFVTRPKMASYVIDMKMIVQCTLIIKERGIIGPASLLQGWNWNYWILFLLLFQLQPLSWTLFG